MNIIKQKALSILEKTVIKTGTVLDVRAWEPATFFEIDLHLPETDMSGWNAVQHMKCKVTTGTYRDYTPAGWDAETHTCTLYIDTSHDGPGSAWASSLRKGNTIQYLGIAPTAHRAMPENQWVCLGDASSIGHFLALRQLADEHISLTGALAIDKAHQEQFTEYLSLPVTTVTTREKGGLTGLSDWLRQQQFSNAAIYIAGHIPTATRLKSELKQRRDIEGRIRIQGFWC